MSHHHHHHSHPAAHARDRTLVLRILVPSLRTALRDKMAALEEKVASDRAAARMEQQRRQARAQQSLGLAAAGGMAAVDPEAAAAAGASASPSSRVLDLDGVSCAPLGDGSTLWSFRCDGMTYPARLVNLPCPVEVHKTFDHALYYKCVDVGQVLIVYEDMTHLEEAEGVPNYKIEGYPSYYHSGLTPPMKRVVERRFAAREHRSVAPSKAEVADVERELRTLIGRITKGGPGTGKGKGKGKAPGLGHGGQTKAIEEIVEDVVDYEPWMDDDGRVPGGVAFDEKDVMATKHPEVWLDPEDVRDERAERNRKGDATAAASAAATDAGSKPPKAKKKDDGGSTTTTTTKKKKDGSTKKKKKKKDAAAAADEVDGASSQPPPSEPHVKKGIPSLKAREAAAAAAAAATANDPNAVEVDEVTQVATQIANMESNDEELLALDDFFNFDGDDDFADMVDM